MHIESIEVEGFWGYRTLQHVDLGGLPLIVGVGENGSGKSALLVHAVLAAFYGRFPTRTLEESITDGAAAGTVSVEFTIDSTRYRVERTHPRTGKATAAVLVSEADSWRALTESGTREVTAYMTELVGMDYETATMTWIAEQGQYGKFSAAQPAERFRLLSGIFGLDVYTQRAVAAAERAHEAASTLLSVDGRIAELHATLERDLDAPPAEYDDLTDDALAIELAEGRDELARIDGEVAKLNAADLDAEVNTASAALERAQADRLHRLELSRAAVTQAEASLTAATERADAARFAATTRCTQTIADIRSRTAGVRAAAQQTTDTARATLARIAAAEAEIPALAAAIATYTRVLTDGRVEAEQLDARLAASGSRRGELQGEAAGLTAETVDAKARIAALGKSDHAACFTCGQHLSAADVAALIASQQRDVDTASGRQVMITAELSSLDVSMHEDSTRRSELATALTTAEVDLHAATTRQESANLLIGSRDEQTANIDEAARQIALADEEELEAVKSAEGERDSTLRIIDTQRRAETTAAQADLDAASAGVTAATSPSETETSLTATLTAARAARTDAETRRDAQLSSLAAERSDHAGRVSLMAGEVARRKEAATLRGEQQARLDAALTERKTVERDGLVFSTLQRAYSPAGIPAMILAGVVDELNETIDATLDRLSRGELHIQLRASREKAKGGAENKVTVYVQTPTGTRSYEALSGGQKFRVDLAIRTGLTQALARGTGTPVRTFILDEGWGSLDEKGILSTVDTLYRLSETTNVITVSHQDVVRDAFPVRVEVSRESGSSVAEVVR